MINVLYGDKTNNVAYLHIRSTFIVCSLKALFFSILGLRISFQNIKVGGGKKIKIKNTKKEFFI